MKLILTILIILIPIISNSQSASSIEYQLFKLQLLEYYELKQIVKYCEPNILNDSIHYIESVKISNSKYNSLSNGYSLNSNIIFLKTGEDVNVSISSNKNEFYYWKIWFDYNGDSDFNDTGECIKFGYSKKDFKFTFVPISESISTIFRISMSIKPIENSCDSLIGEVEDYMVLLSDVTLTSIDGVDIYPNEMQQNLILYLNKISKNDYYIIYNFYGEKLDSNIIHSHYSQIDFSTYSKGTYIIKIVNNDKIKLKKFVRK